MIGTNQKVGLQILATLSRIGFGVVHQDAGSLFSALTFLSNFPLDADEGSRGTVYQAILYLHKPGSCVSPDRCMISQRADC